MRLRVCLWASAFNIGRNVKRGYMKETAASGRGAPQDWGQLVVFPAGRTLCYL